jgi:hypothetical protein
MDTQNEKFMGLLQFYIPSLILTMSKSSSQTRRVLAFVAKFNVKDNEEGPITRAPPLANILPLSKRLSFVPQRIMPEKGIV